MAALAPGQTWIDYLSRVAQMIPAVDLIAIHIDKVGDAVGTAEADKAVVGTRRVVNCYAGWVDAG